MTRKKKIIIITSSVILGIIVLSCLFILIMFLILPNGNSIKPDEVRRIAIEEFGMDEVLVVSYGTEESSIATQPANQYYRPIYALGVKDGKDSLIIVPDIKKYPAYEVDWPFEETFEGMIAKLNEYAEKVVCEPKDYNHIYFIDNKARFHSYNEALNEMPIDVEFVIKYNEYLIAQSQHEFVILYDDWYIHKDFTAENFANKEFGMEVWVLSRGTESSSIVTQPIKCRPIYVLGEKEGKELFIIIPELMTYSAYEANWPFDATFEEMIAKLNEFAGSAVCGRDDYKDICFLDNKNMYEIPNDISLDLDFVIQYKEYLIAQSQHEIVIFN